MRQVILDTETTGLKPSDGHRIIEIGCVELVNRRLTDRTFHQYINPEREVERGAYEVHGLSNKFLSDKPLMADVVEPFLEFIRGAELVIHNAPFDVGFINNEFELLKRGFGCVDDYCTVLDTLKMARKMHPGQRNSLDALCKRYEIDNSHRERHGALLDSEILALVYLAMTSGQDSLFAGGDEQKPGDVGIEAHQPINLGEQQQFEIIYADDKELVQHQKVLDDLLESSGKSAWLEED